MRMPINFDNEIVPCMQKLTMKVIRPQKANSESNGGMKAEI